MGASGRRRVGSQQHGTVGSEGPEDRGTAPGSPPTKGATLAALPWGPRLCLRGRR